MRHSLVLVWTCSSSGLVEAGFLSVCTAGVPDLSPFQTVKGGGSGLLMVSCRSPNLYLPVTIPPAPNNYSHYLILCICISYSILCARTPLSDIELKCDSYLRTIRYPSIKTLFSLCIRFVSGLTFWYFTLTHWNWHDLYCCSRFLVGALVEIFINGPLWIMWCIQPRV